MVFNFDYFFGFIDYDIAFTFSFHALGNIVMKNGLVFQIFLCTSPFLQFLQAKYLISAGKQGIFFSAPTVTIFLF